MREIKRHFNVTKEAVEKALEDLTVGERALLFEGDYSVVSARTLLSRFFCHEDKSPVDMAVAKRVINLMSREEFDEAIKLVSDSITDVLIPPESASAS